MRLEARPGPVSARGSRSQGLRFAARPCPPGPSGALHSGVATKGPRVGLLIGGIALLREALYCLAASALLPYLVHRFLKQHIPAHAHGYADRLLLHG